MYLINELSDGTAITIHQAIVWELKALGLNIANMVGFASDGASWLEESPVLLLGLSKIYHI